MNLVFSSSNIYRRATTAISVLWLFIGTSIYISTFGWYNTWDEVRESIPSLLSWWVTLCYKMGVTVFTQYSSPIDTVAALKAINNNTYIPSKLEISFNLIGYLMYITVPIICIWALLYGYRWVVKEDI